MKDSWRYSESNRFFFFDIWSTGWHIYKDGNRSSTACWAATKGGKKKVIKMTDFYEDACYLSNSEAEPDSEAEDNLLYFSECKSTAAGSSQAAEQLAWDDPQALLNTWLGELDSLKAVSVFLALPHRVLLFVFCFVSAMRASESERATILVRVGMKGGYRKERKRKREAHRRLCLRPWRL